MLKKLFRFVAQKANVYPTLKMEMKLREIIRNDDADHFKEMLNEYHDLLQWKIYDSTFGVTPVWSAVRHGSAKILEVIFNQDPTQAKIESRHGENLFLAAVFNRQENILPLLSRAGVNINRQKDFSLMTPLMYADNAIALQTLLALKPDVTLANASGHNALMCLCLAKDPTDMPERKNMIGQLLQAGIDIDAKDKRGRTALDLCLSKDGKTELIEFLIERGAQTDTPYIRGLQDKKKALGDVLSTIRERERGKSAQEISRDIQGGLKRPLIVDPPLRLKKKKDI